MQENKDTIVFVVLMLGGFFSIISSIANWDFFFESRKARFFTSVLGRNGARIFYLILGGFLVVISMLLMAGIVD